MAALRVRYSPVKLGDVAHGLGRPLIVSLTSYPPRYGTLALTLRCLLSQSVRADALVLWIATKAIGELPSEVLELKSYGLTVRQCDEMGSYKKIIPALREYPGAFIATADDDSLYPRTWLQGLVEGQRQRPGTIVCHRARAMQFDPDGSLAPYRNWQPATGSETLPLMPVGVGGVLYPPGSLPEEVSDREAFMKLSPTADDLWLKWMSAAAGASVHLVHEGGPTYNWPRSQRVRLVTQNLVRGGNDRQIAALSARFGTEAVRATGATRPS